MRYFKVSFTIVSSLAPYSFMNWFFVRREGNLGIKSNKKKSCQEWRNEYQLKAREIIGINYNLNLIALVGYKNAFCENIGNKYLLKMILTSYHKPENIDYRH